MGESAISITVQVDGDTLATTIADDLPLGSVLRALGSVYSYIFNGKSVDASKSAKDLGISQGSWVEIIRKTRGQDSVGDLGPSNTKRIRVEDDLEREELIEEQVLEDIGIIETMSYISLETPWVKILSMFTPILRVLAPKDWQHCGVTDEASLRAIMNPKSYNGSIARHVVEDSFNNFWLVKELSNEADMKREKTAGDAVAATNLKDKVIYAQHSFVIEDGGCYVVIPWRHHVKNLQQAMTTGSISHTVEEWIRLLVPLLHTVSELKRIIDLTDLDFKLDQVICVMEGNVVKELLCADLGKAKVCLRTKTLYFVTDPSNLSSGDVSGNFEATMISFMNAFVIKLRNRTTKADKEAHKRIFTIIRQFTNNCFGLPLCIEKLGKEVNVSDLIKGALIS